MGSPVVKKIWSMDMKIKTKDKVPKSVFFEYFVSEAHGCSVGVNKHDSHYFLKGKKLC